jgi:hypothetical protein
VRPTYEMWTGRREPWLSELGGLVQYPENRPAIAQGAHYIVIFRRPPPARQRARATELPAARRAQSTAAAISWTVPRDRTMPSPPRQSRCHREGASYGRICDPTVGHPEAGQLRSHARKIAQGGATGMSISAASHAQVQEWDESSPIPRATAVLSLSAVGTRPKRRPRSTAAALHG